MTGHLPSLYWGVLVIADAMTVCAGLNPGSSGPDHGDVERTQLVVQLLQQATYAFEGLHRSTKKWGKLQQNTRWFCGLQRWKVCVPFVFY